MADLIDRGDFRQAFECVFRGKLDGMSAQDVTRRMRKLLKELPGVDAAPVVHGRWVDEDYPYKDANANPRVTAICSNCGNIAHRMEHGYSILSKYCPNCGAKMDLEV